MSKNGQVSLRILAGKWRGRKVEVPNFKDCRPTLTRARQALFDHLMHHAGQIHSFDGCQILDLYAGSGSLALEIMSRGAAKVTCVERNRGAIKVIERSFADLEGQATLICQDVISWLQEDRSIKMDIIFADPPYTEFRNGEAWPDELHPSYIKKILRPGGKYILQHQSNVAPPNLTDDDGMVLSRTVCQGLTQFSIFTTVV